MTATLVGRAPGKLMLSGEYAVLAGAPAVIACVDRYVTARIRRRPAGAGSRAVLHGFADSTREFRIESGEVRWHGTSPAPALLDALLTRFPPPGDIEIEIDSSAFYTGGRKLGLGSSAAVAVAAGRALAELVADAEPIAGVLAAHRRFQRGRGSGADVIAVDRGGLQSVRVDGIEPRCRSLRWPAGLRIATVMTGQPASTVEHVSRFQRWREGADASMAGLRDAALDAEAAWRDGDPDAVIAALAAGLEIMRGISDSAALDYFGGGHESLCRVASEAGVFYKPCGAGGGDFGIALSTDGDAMMRFRAAVPATGHRIVPLSLLATSPESETTE
jgi:phosphomevalonate kinase